MNIDELVELFKLKSSFQNNDDIHMYIKNYLNSINISFTELEDKTIFNIDNSNAPIFSAHTDTVRTKKDDSSASKVKIETASEFRKISIHNHILGGDDLCGVYIILNLIKEYRDNINFVFSNNEEVQGYQTARDFVADFDLIGYPYCIVLDRKGSSDIISYLNNYGSREFELDLASIGNHFGYTPNRGYFSDADFFRNHMSSANISCGYFNAHSKDEFVIYEFVENAFNYSKAIIENLRDKEYKLNEETFSWAFERQIINNYARIYNSAFGKNPRREK